MELTTAIREAMTSLATTRLVIRPLTGDLFGDDMIVGVPCRCVQDSPENPCLCPSWPIIAVTRASVVSEGDADRSTKDGEQLRWIDLDRDTRILVLGATPITAATLDDSLQSGEGGQGIAFRRSTSIDDSIRYMAAFWRWILYDAWGPIIVDRPERP